MRFEGSPSNHSNTALVPAPAGLLPATSCHTSLLLDILKSPPLRSYQPLSWSQMMLAQASGAWARGMGMAGPTQANLGESPGPPRKSSHKARQWLCSRHTKRTQVRALGLGLELKLTTLGAWFRGPGHCSSVKAEVWGGKGHRITQDSP